MTGRSRLLLLLPALFWLIPVALHAEDSEEFERRITQELRDTDPTAADLFSRANAATEQGNLLLADSLYFEVNMLQPSFYHALRRRGWVQLTMGNRPDAITLARQAQAIEETVENAAFLASALAQETETSIPTTEEQSEAQGLAMRILRIYDPDKGELALICKVGLFTDDPKLLRQGVDRLREIAPEWPTTDLFTWFLAMIEERREDARQAVSSAQMHGAEPEQLAFMEEAMRAAEPFYARWLKPAAWIGGIWIAGMLLLLFVGYLLSGAAMRAASRVPTVQSGQATGLDAKLRRAYEVVLWLCCAYYYVSLPLVLIVVVVAGGAVLYGFLTLGRIPIKLILIVGAVVLVTLWATLKSFLVRGKDEDPGTRLDLEKHPKLQSVLREVASKIETRPVDNVYLTPGTELAVMERGGIAKQLRQASERCLILGVGVLEGMKLGQFRAVLAHEYGHFSNRDTAGGGFALAVRRSLMTMAMNLAEGGAATWYSPAWLFLNGFHRVFLSISQGASRLQEVLADRWAAFAYGAASFEAGLRHVIERSIRFNRQVNDTLREVIDKKRPLSNLYTFQPSAEPDEEMISAATESAIQAEPSVYDSHPSPRDRFAWVHALGTDDASTRPDDLDEVWSLFSDRHAIEQEMTEEIREAIERAHGFPIPKEA